MFEQNVVELPMLPSTQISEQERNEGVEERVVELKKEMNKDTLAEKLAVAESEIEQLSSLIESLKREGEAAQEEIQQIRNVELALRRELDAYRTQVIQNQQNQLSYLQSQQENGTTSPQVSS